VHGKLAAKALVSPQTRSPEFVSGEIFSYLGRGFRLKVVKEQREALNFDGDRFLLRSDSRPKAAEHFRRWYRQTGAEWLRQRVKTLAPRVGVNPSDIRVRDLGFRWASCGVMKVLSFHWKLLQLPVRLVDYVIIHEMTHLLHPHHNAEFWACVDRALPDWRERKAHLAEHATYYLSFGG
jgi:predicted metal-dependent hydrolase